MSRPETNWGGDLVHRVHPSRQAGYTRACVRLNAHHENDEILCLVDFLDVHTRIGLDTADRVEHAARASEAAAQRIERAVMINRDVVNHLEQLQRETSTREVSEARSPRKFFHRNLWFYTAAVSILVVVLVCLWDEMVASHKVETAQQQALDLIDNSLRQSLTERNEDIALAQMNAPVLRWLLQARIQVYAAPCTFQDGGKGFYIYSPSAIGAQMTTGAEGQPIGAVYFRLPAVGIPATE